MLLGLKDHFIPYVEDGSKRHTIRAGFRWKVGMRADLYAESRRRKVWGQLCPVTRRRWEQCDCGHCERGSVEPIRAQIAGMRLLFRAPVVKVEAITITTRGIYIRHDRPWTTEWAYTKAAECGMVKLSKDEAELFAFRDGFRFDPNSRGSFGLMMDYWKGTYKLPFHGQIIHWDYDNRFTDLHKPRPTVTLAEAAAWGKRFEGLAI